MSRTSVERNVHFLDGVNHEVAGFWQNGSVIWEEVLEWIHLVFTNPISEYTPFRCLEDGDPQDPAAKHGPPIHLASNKLVVDTGYYVILSPDGRHQSSKFPTDTTN
jgi:hypothetical protein